MAERNTVVKLAEYKGIPVKKRIVEVTEQEIDDELERARTYASTTKDKPDGAAEMGDQVVIDFIGYIDGKPFEGGDGMDYPLTLGSNTFIPGFEEQLVGAKSGDFVDVNVSFPENYHDGRYAGREAVFKVTVKSLRSTIIPELDDEMVSRISPCGTVDEFRDYVRNEIKMYKENKNREDMSNEVLAKLVENSEIAVPEELVEDRAARLKDNLIAQIGGSGMTMEAYLDYNNITEDIIDEYNRTNALNLLRGQAVLGEVARAEGITCSEEELEGELFMMARKYQTTVDELREMLGEEGIEMVKEDLIDEKTLRFVVEQSVETE